MAARAIADTGFLVALFDGLDRVSAQHSQQVKLSGFKVPDAGFDAKLGIIAFEGDNNNTGDSIFFNPTDPALPDATEALHDALNPANNFFNGTRSTLGMAVSPEGDVPRLAGTPQSMSGVDIDVVDVSAKLKAGDQEATIVANSALDLFFLAGWVTSISTYGPDFSGSNKVATDLNGTPTFRGDVVEYSITTANSGNDDSIDTVVVDTLPAGVTLVPGSLQIVEGDNRIHYIFRRLKFIFVVIVFFIFFHTVAVTEVHPCTGKDKGKPQPACADQQCIRIRCVCS